MKTKTRWTPTDTLRAELEAMSVAELAVIANAHSEFATERMMERSLIARHIIHQRETAIAEQLAA